MVRTTGKSQVSASKATKYGRSMRPREKIRVDLTPSERKVLVFGLLDWFGPARCTEEMAIALGFKSYRHFSKDSRRLMRALESNAPMSRLDWLRTLLATEVCFASNVLGSGTDWVFTCNISDEDSIKILRSLQRRLTAEIVGLIGNGFGTLPKLTRARKRKATLKTLRVRNNRSRSERSR
jgi:hypothetical protein